MERKRKARRIKAPWKFRAPYSGIADVAIDIGRTAAAATAPP